MKAGKIIILVLIAALLGWGIFNLEKEKNSLRKEAKSLELTLDALKKENDSLLADIEYYKRPENLLKELKSQFNYKEEGEKLIIIVPKRD